MRIAWGLWAAAAILMSPAQGGGGLYPEPSGWGLLDAGASLADRRAEVDYMAIIAAAMPEGFGSDVRVRLIEDHLGSDTLVVALKQTGTDYHIVQAKSAAWLKTNPQVQVSRCTVPIDRATGEEIIAAWKSVLVTTSYANKPDFGGTGAIEHFALSLEGRWLAGWAYAPETTTPPGRLVRLAMAMTAVCMRNEGQERQRLSDELAAFPKP